MRGDLNSTFRVQYSVGFGVGPSKANESDLFTFPNVKRLGAFLGWNEFPCLAPPESEDTGIRLGAVNGLPWCDRPSRRGDIVNVGGVVNSLTPHPIIESGVRQQGLHDLLQHTHSAL